MVIRIGAADLDAFIPQHRRSAENRPPVEFYKLRDALGIHQAESIYAKTLHHAERSRNSAIRHGPHNHVQRLGHQRNEIPESVMRRTGLRVTAVRFHLYGMNQVRKFNGILNEKHWDVISDEVKVPFLRVKLHREAAYIARHVYRTSTSGNRRKAHQDWRLDVG